MSLKLFYCYAREDKLLRDALGKHLGNLKRQNLITDWHDRNIDAGHEWAKEISTHLNEADIILLLISPDFVHSEYCYSIEMNRALERHENGTARVIPIILRPGDYVDAPFSKLQALPTDAIPITDRKWRNRDEALFNIAQGLRKAVRELLCDEWLSKGNEYFLRNQYTEALDAFEQATYFNPDNVLALLAQGRALNAISLDSLSVENYERALAAFTRAIELDPLNAEAYVGKGTSLYNIEINDLEEHMNKASIFEAYAYALQLDPNNERAYTVQGNAFLYYKDFKEALSSYEHAINVAAIPNRYVYKRKGDALLSLERYKEAIEAYEICIKEGLNNKDMYVNIGKAQFELRKYTLALKAYEKALSLDPSSSSVYLKKGDALYRLTKYREALEAYEKAINLMSAYEKSDVAQAYRRKAKVWQHLSQEALRKADKLDPSGKYLIDDLDDLGELDTRPF